MKKLLFAIFATLLLASCNTTKPTVEWVEGDRNPETGLYENEFIVRGVPADSKDWVIWFWSQTLTKYELVESDGMKLDVFKARIHMLRPEGTPKVPGEYRLRYRTSAKMWNVSKFPSRFSFRNGTEKPMAIEATYKMLPLASDGEEIYKSNAEVTISESAPEHIVPYPKSIVYSSEGTTDLSAWQRATADVKMVNEEHPKGWYRITLDGAIKIEAADEYGAYYAGTTLENIKTNSTTAIAQAYPIS